MKPLDLVKLTALMERTSGRAEVKVALIDGPIATGHPDLAGERLQEVPGNINNACADINSTACQHGTFVAGILSANRGSAAPAICPDCTLLVRPLFAEAASDRERAPGATPKELAAAIIECIDAGARVINLSLGLTHSFTKDEACLEDALNEAVRHGVIVVAAAGNQGTLGSSVITRHVGVIPVVACDRAGRPMHASNLGHSIGKRGLSAPGEGITSLGAKGQPLTLSGSSVAVPFVTGAAALLWSAFPSAAGAQIKLAMTSSTPRRSSVFPPLLDVDAAYKFMLHSANACRSTSNHSIAYIFAPEIRNTESAYQGSAFLNDRHGS